MDEPVASEIQVTVSHAIHGWAIRVFLPEKSLFKHVKQAVAKFFEQDRTFGPVPFPEFFGELYTRSQTPLPVFNEGFFVETATAAPICDRTALTSKGSSCIREAGMQHDVYTVTLRNHFVGSTRCGCLVQSQTANLLF